MDRRVPRAHPARLAVAALVVAVAACHAPLEDPSLVLDLRVLGIRADPPEVLYTAPSPYTIPDTVDRSFKLTVLLADPTGAGRTLRCRLQSCPLPSSNSWCTDLANTWGLGEQDCAAGETSFHVTLPADLVQAVQQGDSAYKACVGAQAGLPLPSCGYSGLAVWIDVVVTGGERELHALKSFVISPVVPDDRKPNQNPDIAGLVKDGALLPDPPTFRFAPGTESQLELAWPGGQPLNVEQHYRLPTFGGGPIDLDEFLTVSYYADAGSFSSARASDQPSNPFSGKPSGSEPVDLSTRWAAPAPAGAGNADPGASGPVHFWFVVTDGRGGVRWETATANQE